MNIGTSRSEALLTACGAVVMTGLETGDFVVELMEIMGVVDVTTSEVGVIEGPDVDVFEGSGVGVVEGAFAPPAPHPAKISERTAAPATERAAYQQCCSTRTHGSEWNHAKWSKLGMMAW